MTLRLRFRPGDIQKIKSLARKMNQRDIKKLYLQGLREWAFVIRDLVKRAYRDSGYPIHPLTATSYMYPPDPSHQPKRPRVRANSSLKRTGILQNSVVARKTRRGYTAQIDPKKVYKARDPYTASRGGGRNKVAFIAKQMEDPKPFTVSVTPRMFKYLRFLAMKTAGKQKKGSAAASAGPRSGIGLKIGSILFIRPKAKPIWEPAAKHAMRVLEPYMKDVTGFYMRAPGKAVNIQSILRRARPKLKGG